jgi:hypothetical protein
MASNAPDAMRKSRLREIKIRATYIKDANTGWSQGSIDLSIIYTKLKKVEKTHT